MKICMTVFLSNSLLFLILIGLSIKDFKDGIIPDICLLALTILGVLQFGRAHVMSVLILGGLAYSLYKLYPLLKKQEGLGFGDVKMMAVSGFWLDPFQIPLFLILSGGIGVGIACIWRFLKKKPRFPLGPALALALGTCIVGTQVFSKGESEMILTFSGPSLAPASGLKPDSIVVLLHGYGANGDDLLALGEAWASYLPNTLFVAPHGPALCEINASGNQWFSLRDWEPAQLWTQIQLERIMGEIQKLTPSFNHYLDELLKTYNLPPERLALVGFSQGAMIALHVALHRAPCAGVVAYSGGFLKASTEYARPPVLLIHGLEDQLLPAFFSREAEKKLKALNVPVTLSLLPGLSHGIDERGLKLGGAFLKQNLDEPFPFDLRECVNESIN